MTPKQNALYWREWGALTRRCTAEGWTAPDRHEIHTRALGVDKSHLSFTNRDFDLVLGVFRSYSQAESVDGQLRQIAQPTTRKAVKLQQIVRCLALYVSDADAYVAHVCLDKFRTPDWNDLSDAPPPLRGTWQPPSQLEQLIMTLSRALNGKDGYRNQAQHTLDEMHALARGGSARAANGVASQREAAQPQMAVDGNPDWTS